MIDRPHKKPFIIAVDGPAASGKGTLSRRIAAHYGWRHLDTGLTYRAVAHAMLAQGADFTNEADAAKIARNLDFGNLDRETLAQHKVGAAASKIAVMSSVRTALVVAQRAFAQNAHGAVLDGRDIGTVVCPEATVKLFVTASPEIRAKRRTHEILSLGGDARFEQVLHDLKERDERDMNRKDSPLRPAQDAHLLDTSDMTIEAAFITARDLIDQAIA